MKALEEREKHLAGSNSFIKIFFFELPDKSYSRSVIQDYFDCSNKQH